MTDYDDLIERLISEANDTKYMLGHASSLHTAAAYAIKELVAERDKLVSVICEHVAKRKEYFDRAEKAEADLAAARAALRGASTIIMRPSWYEAHDTAIAAARAEKEKTND